MTLGLSPAPALFTRVLRWPLSLLRSQGVHILAYLDDWILWALSSDTLREHVRWTCTTLSRLGWNINWPKSHLTLSTDLIWLGVHWLPQLGRWGLPPDKVREITQLAMVLLTSSHAFQMSCEQFVCKLVFATQVLRPLQPLLQLLFAPRCFSQVKSRYVTLPLPSSLLTHVIPLTCQERLSVTPTFYIAGPVQEI